MNFPGLIIKSKNNCSTHNGANLIIPSRRVTKSIRPNVSSTIMNLPWAKDEKEENKHSITTQNTRCSTNDKSDSFVELSCPEENDILPNYTDASIFSIH